MVGEFEHVFEEIVVVDEVLTQTVFVSFEINTTLKSETLYVLVQSQLGQHLINIMVYELFRGFKIRME